MIGKSFSDKDNVCRLCFEEIKEDNEYEITTIDRDFLWKFQEITRFEVSCYLHEKISTLIFTYQFFLVKSRS